MEQWCSLLLPLLLLPSDSFDLFLHSLNRLQVLTSFIFCLYSGFLRLCFKKKMEAKERHNIKKAISWERHFPEETAVESSVYQSCSKLLWAYHFLAAGAWQWGTGGGRQDHWGLSHLQVSDRLLHPCPYYTKLNTTIYTNPCVFITTLKGHFCLPQLLKHA